MLQANFTFDWLLIIQKRHVLRLQPQYFRQRLCVETNDNTMLAGFQFRGELGAPLKRLSIDPRLGLETAWKFKSDPALLLHLEIGSGKNMHQMFSSFRS